MDCREHVHRIDVLPDACSGGRGQQAHGGIVGEHAQVEERVLAACHDGLENLRHALLGPQEVGELGEPCQESVDAEQTPYNPWLAYAQSKTANVLFAVEAARRWAGDGIVANALNPGRIAGTGLIRHIDPSAIPPRSFDPEGNTGVSVKDIPQCAATSTLLAGSPLVAGITGHYFEDCRIAPPHTPGVRRGVAAYAVNPERAQRLWQMSSGMLAAAGY